MSRYEDERLRAVLSAWQSMKNARAEDAVAIETLVAERAKRREREFRDALEAALVDGGISKLRITQAGGPARPTLDRWLEKLGLWDEVPKMGPGNFGRRKSPLKNEVVKSDPENWDGGGGVWQ